MVRSLIGRGVAAAVLLSCSMLFTGRAEACSVCGCDDPLVAAGDSSPMPGKWRLALDYEYLSARAASDDDPDASETLRQNTVRPVVVFSPIDSLNLVLQVPLVRKDWALEGEEARTASPSGVGDLDVGGRLFVYQHASLQDRRRTSLAVSAGLTLPTGSNDLTVDGERLDDHAQLGTGALGPYAGLLSAFHQDPWNLTADVYVRTHSQNRFGYTYGDALVGGLHGEFRVREQLALVLGLDARYAARDRSGEELLANTGGLLLAATPGLMVNVQPQLWLHLRAQLPFYTHLFGDQQVGPTLSASLNYSFN